MDYYIRAVRQEGLFNGNGQGIEIKGTRMCDIVSLLPGVQCAGVARWNTLAKDLAIHRTICLSWSRKAAKYQE